jgi:SAM-dependent methyltransferase/uncharacterized protein YbaR (Trm112 family)
MRSSLLEYLRCPMGCQTGLVVAPTEAEDSEVLNGSLTCPECARAWPIDQGIPRLLPAELLESTASNPKSEIQDPDSSDLARKRTEMFARDAQAAEYDRMWHLNLFGLVEIPVTLLKMGLAGTHTLLEAGCGTGRMTGAFAARCKELVSVDFSWESLLACKRKLQKAGIKNVHLAQADLCHLPFRTEVFDRVVSCQVLEHIPSAAARSEAVRELARVLTRGGNLTLSAYQYSGLMRLFGEKEGEHDGGIYFFRFTRDELRALLEPVIAVESVTGALVYHYIAKCRK